MHAKLSGKLQARPHYVDEVYRILLDAISDGSLAPGSPLSLPIQNPPAGTRQNSIRSTVMTSGRGSPSRASARPADHVTGWAAAVSV